MFQGEINLNSAQLLLTQIAPNLHIDEGFLFATECT